MGAIRKSWPIYAIFELELSSDPKHMNTKFQHSISIPAEDNAITTYGRTDMTDHEHT